MKRRKTPKDPERNDFSAWLPISGFTLHARRPGATLAVTVLHAEGGEWVCSAIESSIQLKSGTSTAQALSELFDSHSHGMIGSGFALRRVLKDATDYARKWAARAVTLEACECGDIEGEIETSHLMN